MSHYVARLHAILPFEPEVPPRLGGPPTVYVAHPLIAATGQRAATGPPAGGAADAGVLAAAGGAASADAGVGGAGAGPADHRPILLLLPGSRAVELDRLLAIFGEALAIVDRRHPGGVRALLPAVGPLAERTRRDVAGWPVQPEIVVGAEAKAAAFRAARAAMAASGTVTLELALAGVPMVVAYRLDRFYRQVKRLNRVVKIVTAPSMVLANIIVGRNAIPELLDEEVTAEALAGHALALLADGAPRERQLAALAEVADKMAVAGVSPSARAASEILDLLATREPSRATAR
jgi:lipid-A-disaccharide synthase